MAPSASPSGVDRRPYLRNHLRYALGARHSELSAPTDGQEVNVTKLQEDAAATEQDSTTLSLAKETIEDLDAPQDASDEAKGGSGTRTASVNCG